MSFDVTAAAYKNVRYGATDKQRGNLVVLDLKCASENVLTQTNSEVILVVDLSGSMQASIPYLRSSLRAFRDGIVGFKKFSSDEEREDAFRKATDLTLIGYSGIARVLYKSRDSEQVTDWDHVIDNEIYAQDSTNISGALEMAFANTSIHRCTWIVLMTDGQPNVGVQSYEGFETLLKKTPPLTRIISLGYGQIFDAKLLSRIGEFTHVENQEKLPLVFGSLVNETQSSWGFDARWVHGFSGKTVIGKSQIGCLYPERKFTFGLQVTDGDFDKFDDIVNGIRPVSLHLHMIENSKSVDVPFTFKDATTLGVDVAPDSVREKYYASAKGRRLEKISRLLGRRVSNKVILGVCVETRKEMEEWKTDAVADVHRDEIIAMIEKVEELERTGGTAHDYQTLGYAGLTRAGNCSAQSSSVNPHEYTSTQANMCSMMASATQGYQQPDPAS